MPGNKMIELENHLKGDVLVLRVIGRVNVISAPILEKEALVHIQEGCRKLLLDFHGVSYVSSAGLRTLLYLVKEINSRSGRIIVCTTMPGVVDVVKLCGLNEVIQIVKEETRALQFFVS